MMQAVVVVNGTRYPVPEQGLRIGRAPENDLVLSDPNISRQHLVVWSTPRGTFLRDLGSQNGTYIAGRRVGSESEPVPSGAQVRIGVTDLQIEVIQAPGQNGGVPVGGGYAGAGGYAGDGGYAGAGLGERPGSPYGPGPSASPYGDGGQAGAASPNGAPAYGGSSAYGGGYGGGAAQGGGYAPQYAPQRRSGGNTGLIIGGVVGFVILAMVGTAFLVMRAVDDKPAATPTPTVRPVAAVATATTAPTAAPKPTEPPAKPTAAPPPTPVPKPTEPPAKPTAPPQPTEAPKPAGGRDPAFVRALNASVRVIVPTGPTSASIGSGSIFTSKGHILTNFHVVSDETTGKLVNGGNNVIIAVPPAEGENAQPKYRAKVADFDPKLDLAVIQLLAMADGAPLPADLGLTPIPIGSSKSVNIGDTIIIIGFPGLGGSSLTVTRGIHSGISRLSDDPGSFIKTDTEINRGNSGGTAINAAGELIGIPTAGRIDKEATGKIGLVRPIDEAKPLLEKFLR
ncbi:MAG: trypsin-like peptidase domain-containing protein [Chloroflexota bacterium]